MSSLALLARVRRTLWTALTPKASLSTSSAGAPQANETQQPSLFFHAGFPVALADSFRKSFTVVPDFVTEEEEQSLLKEVEPHLSRQVYEKDHWDDAISGFRETERKSWQPKNAAVVERMQAAAFAGLVTLPYAHVLDLAHDGHIKPHVDSTRFCGDVVAVLSLMSDCVVRFALASDPASAVVDALALQRSLYIMQGTSRNDFTHAILAAAESRFGDRPVRRARRISLICRCKAEDDVRGGDATGAGQSAYKR